MLTIVILFFLGALALCALAAAVIPPKSAPPGSDARGRRASDDDPSAKTGLAIVAAVLAFAFVAFWFLQSFKIVGANEVAVPVAFGHASPAIGPGAHFVKPWTEITKYPTRPETFTTVAHVRTNQQGQVAVQITGRWSTTRSAALDLYRQQRQGADKIESSLVDPQAQGAMGAFYGGLDNTTSVSGSSWIRNAAGSEGILAAYLAPYGIHVDQMRIIEVNPSPETNSAIARVAQQKLETQVASESVQTAIQQAAQQKQVADGQAAAAAKVANLTPAEVQVLCLQAAERISNKNTEKGLPTYTLPCESGSGSFIAK